MVSEKPQVDLMGSIWAAGKDGEWHTAKEIASLLGCTSTDVEDVLEFFTKYGFAKRSVGLHEDKYQLILNLLSPMETVAILKLMRMEAEQKARIS